ncbi:hypothetical protein Asulf_00745 [Archaeoglobus sulfaticallidus PM70-1]|uniref:DUF72 domain-containing protein n=1 Tax=Archaeoglobus sulfaticallidus PM70-1 TaxID=387631 RepID=N0BCM1_9EURY|nr:DUF72 domain-containing protein [Archaeoglobus sulfaticallidus]AGK60758.1 hypothetical protein Asulf_00745 [Archaeoglobus sulfaticallidus PM70-1]
MIKVGCCGFPTPMNKYFSFFDVVEVQKTFYDFPRIDSIKRWREKTDSINRDFEFIIKANQLITHPPSSPTYKKSKLKPKNSGFFRMVEEVTEALKKTVEIADILRCDKILFQTPPSFKHSSENIENMERFFTAMKNYGKFRIILELRGWKEAEILDALERLSSFSPVHCVDPFRSRQLSGEFQYFRLHGRYESNRIIYSYKYSNSELSSLKKLVKKGYVMFNNKYMLEDAMRFKEILNSD